MRGPLTLYELSAVRSHLIQTLSDERLLAPPEATLAANHDWLHLPLDDGDLEETADSPHSRSHAKESWFGFSPETNRSENQEAATRHQR